LGEAAWRAIIPAGERRVVVAPGSGLAAKSWPLPSYAELTARLAGIPGTVVAVAGGPGDRAAGEWLASAAHPGAKPAVNLAGHLSLRETFALIAAADLVVCNSSVLMHAAAAFDKPTLVLLGESFPSARQHQAQWGYPGISVSLGKESGEREAVATVDEAMAAIETLRTLRAFEPPGSAPATREARGSR
jgi:heptosyltransferase-2